MTKKELLEMLWRNQAKCSICREFYDKLSDLLKFIKDDKTKIEGLSSLEEFEKNKNAFNDFISANDNNRNKIEMKLNAIYTEITTWVTKDITTHENNSINTINRRKLIVSIIFAIIIGALALAAIVCTILHIFFEFEYGDQVAEAIGTFDFALGITAFIIERFSDIKKDGVRAFAQEVRETGDVEGAVRNIKNIFSPHHNSGNVIQDIDVDEVAELVKSADDAAGYEIGSPHHNSGNVKQKIKVKKSKPAGEEKNGKIE